MSYRDVISVRELRRRFHYLPEGCLVRIVKTHTRSWVGEKVWGCSSGKNTRGPHYIRLQIGHRKYIPFHVAVFAVVRGRFPKALLDHKDRNGLNNKIGNLREATHSQNSFNAKLTSKNKSGYRGVLWRPTRQRWDVCLTKQGKHYFLGHFKKKSEAIKAQRTFVLKHHKDFRAIQPRRKTHGTNRK